MHANRLMPNVYRKKLLAFTIKPVIIALVIRRAGEELLSVSPGEDCAHDLFHGRVILEGMEIGHHGHQALPVLHDRSAELF